MLHELGHCLGLEDGYSDIRSDWIMNGRLDTGLRRLPTEVKVALLLAELS